MTEVVERSGRRVLRALLTDERDEDVAAIAAEVNALRARTGVLLEWSELRLVAIEVSSEADTAGVLGYLAELAEAGRLEWEWSDAGPFVA